MPSVAVVTGGGRGLGRAIATALAGRGFEVLLTDVDGAAAAATAQAIGRGAWSMAQDVRDPASHRAVAAAAATRGPVAVWVNNAGVLHVGAAWESTEAGVRRMVEVNVLGVSWGSQRPVAAVPPGGPTGTNPVALACEAAGGAMAQGGHLINTASRSSCVPAPGLAVYAATKHAVLGFSTSLAGDLRRAKVPIHVVTICPDAVETDMVKNVAHHQASDILFSAGKMLTADDVAAAVIDSLDHPRLVRILPAARAAMVHALHPFPALGLRLLEQFAALGNRRKARRGG